MINKIMMKNRKVQCSNIDQKKLKNIIEKMRKRSKRMNWKINSISNRNNWDNNKVINGCQKNNFLTYQKESNNSLKVRYNLKISKRLKVHQFIISLTLNLKMQKLICHFMILKMLVNKQMQQKLNKV